MRCIWLPILLAVLPGCLVTPSSCARIAPAAPALAPLGAAQAERSSKAAAAVEAARLANGQNPEGPPKASTEGELGVAASNLPVPSDKDRAEANARVAVGLRGDLDKANAQWAAARHDAEALSLKISALEQKVVVQQQEAVRRQADLEAKHQQEIQDLKDQNSKHLQAWAARILIGVGIAGLAACAFAIFSSGLTALPKAGLGAVASLLFIGAGIIVGQPWFLWAVGIAAVVGIAAIIWYSAHLHQTSKIATALSRRDQDLADAALEGNQAAQQALAELSTHTQYRVSPSVDRTIKARLIREGVNAPKHE